MVPSRAVPPYEERRLFASPVVRIGAFRCRPHYERFHDTGPIHDTLIVFPRTPVLITHAGGSPIVADPCTVMFYNPAQLYRRDALSEHGDVCEWFAFDATAVIEALRVHDPAVETRAGCPFAWTHGPSEPASYARQRAVTAALDGGPGADPLLVEEIALGLLRRAVDLAALRRSDPVPAPTRVATRRAHRDVVETLKAILAARYAEDLRLSDLARLVHGSPFHLSRVFARETGTTLHAYRDQIRLRAALGPLLDGCRDLARLAVDLGYSSHSHFTHAFRRAFGVSPSAARTWPDRLAEASKMLTA